MILQKSGQHCYVSVYQIIPEDVPKVFYKFRKHDRRSVGYLWLSGHSQVDYGLGDHFAITVAHLLPKCALSMGFQFSPFRFPCASIYYSGAEYSAFWCFRAKDWRFWRVKWYIQYAGSLVFTDHPA